MTTKNILSVIADPTTDLETVVTSVKKLGDVDESPAFWTRIANDNSFSAQHRRIFIFQLFLRHVKNEITLRQFSKILDKPSWLKIENISVVRELAGKIPITFDMKNTILAIAIFPEISSSRFSHWTIYLKIEGKITSNDFYQLICSENEVAEELQQKKLIEYGLSPDKTQMYDQ